MNISLASVCETAAWKEPILMVQYVIMEFYRDFMDFFLLSPTRHYFREISAQVNLAFVLISQL